jgi:circadian clock protein KaiC
MQISSLTDTWLLLYNRETNGEHNRQLYLLKSRGMAHSNQVREFLLRSDGISLRDVYVGPEGVLTGSALQIQEARDRATRQLREQEVDRRARDLERRRREVAAQIETLQAQLATDESEVALLKQEGVEHDDQLSAAWATMSKNRSSNREASLAPTAVRSNT